jgi:hypothetical protein
MLEMIIKPTTCLISGFSSITITSMIASTSFASEYPEVITYLVSITSLGFVYLMTYIWRTSWKEQSKINEKILDRLEKLDAKVEDKIEKLKEEVFKSEISFSNAKNAEKEMLTRDNIQMQQMINSIRELTGKISNLEVNGKL